MCLLGGGRRDELRNALTAEWFSGKPKQPWILFLADRAGDFISLCRLEHERAWIARMFASVSDHAIYSALIDEYAAESKVLEARGRRVRNALVHGNPASFTVVQSVREYAEFLGGSALNRGSNRTSKTLRLLRHWRPERTSSSRCRADRMPRATGGLASRRTDGRPPSLS
jgi:hypothetical protein